MADVSDILYISTALWKTIQLQFLFFNAVKDNLAYQNPSEILTVREVGVEIEDLDKGKLDIWDKVWLNSASHPTTATRHLTT